MAHPIRIAVQIQPQHADYPSIRDVVARAEDAGVDVVFTWDHFFPLHGEPDGKHFECWTMLGAWAEATDRVEIGALVTCNSYRNPDLLADLVRTVDHISDGRLILGIGAGWFERDYAEHGYDFGTPGSRLADLRLALPRIKNRWTALNPPPTRDIQLLIGGGGERKTLRYVAEHADIWHSFAHLTALQHKSAVLARHCADVGRDPATIERSVGVKGRPGAVAEDLMAAGATLFTIGVSGPDYVHDRGQWPGLRPVTAEGVAGVAGRPVTWQRRHRRTGRHRSARHHRLRRTRQGHINGCTVKESHEPADRGLRGHRGSAHDGAGGPGRLDRLAVPAAVRLRGVLRPSGR